MTYFDEQFERHRGERRVGANRAADNKSVKRIVVDGGFGLEEWRRRVDRWFERRGQTRFDLQFLCKCFNDRDLAGDASNRSRLDAGEGRHTLGDQIVRAG